MASSNLPRDLCLNCKNPVPRRNKFCSCSCANSFNQRGRVSHNKGKLKELKNKCLFCKVKTKNKYFCSNACRSKYKYNTYIIAWKTGLKNGNTAETSYLQIHEYVRKYLFEKYNHKCSSCGWNKINIYTGKIPLTVEHIDGNAENSTEKNLTLLCPNCHSLTKTYGGANRGNGKRKRYNAKPII